MLAASQDYGMPPTLVSGALGVLIGVALLGPAFDRRALSVVVGAAVLPDLDAALSLVIHGATNAVLHSIFIPLGVAVVLYWDTVWRHESWLADRTGWYGVRVAWVAVAAYTFAGIGVDLFNVESVALFYPFSTRYFAIVGQFVISTQHGVIQTYVEVGNGSLQVASPGTTETYHIATWINPTPSPGIPSGGPRRLRLIDRGWQLVVVIAAIATIPAKTIVAGSDH